MAEEKCLRLLRDSNKPYNVQGVADMLATAGVKKVGRGTEQAWRQAAAGLRHAVP